MSVDPNVLAALASALEDLTGAPQKAVPARVLEALAPLAKPGTQLTIDLEASRFLGAPLVTVGAATETSDQLFKPLTPRQRTVAERLIAGRSNKEIARELGISVATVKDHVHAILERLNLPSRMAVMAKAKGV